MMEKKWKAGRNMQRTLGTRVTNLSSLPGTEEFLGVFNAKNVIVPGELEQ